MPIDLRTVVIMGFQSLNKREIIGRLLRTSTTLELFGMRSPVGRRSEILSIPQVEIDI
jgi:hypothetical protein